MRGSRLRASTSVHLYETPPPLTCCSRAPAMKTPVSSLIITVENQWDFTRKCLKSLAAHTEKQTIEVIVIDNASTDETPRGCPFLGGSLFGGAFRYIRNDEKRSFGAAANQGAAVAVGSHLIFLDAKAEVQPGWYEPLLDDFSAWPDLGATAPLLADAARTPLGLTLRHLGVYLGPFLKPGHLYEGIPLDSPLAGKRRFFQALTADFLVIPATHFREAGQFDENAGPDLAGIDLCARLRARGLRMTVNPASLVLCHGGEGAPKGGGTDSWTPGPEALAHLRPDWEELVAADGLSPRLSPWQQLCVALPDDRRAPLDAGLEDLDDAALREALTRAPYWKRGWDEYAGRCRGGAEGAYIVKALPGFFPDPENALGLAPLPWVWTKPPLLAECWQRAQSFLRPPEAYLEEARRGLHWCRKRGLSGLGHRFAELAASFDEFCKNDFSRFARGLWRLERRLGVTHPPEDARAYLLWRHAIDVPARAKAPEAMPPKAPERGGDTPALSLLMTVHHPEAGHLRAALDSVLDQGCPSWELCIAGDLGAQDEAADILRDYAARDSRIRLAPGAGHGPSDALAGALGMARAPWCALLEEDALLSPDAVALVTGAIREAPQGRFFFSDEDSTEDGRGFFAPYFKNGRWDPELAPVQNFAGHLAVFATERLRRLAANGEGCAPAHDHGLVLRYVAGEDPAAIVHIPHVLYHRRAPKAASGAEAEPAFGVGGGARRFLDAAAPGASLQSLPHCPWPRVRYALPAPVPTVSLVCALPGAAFPVADWHAAWARTTALPFECVLVCGEDAFQELRAGLKGLAETLRLIPAPAGLSAAERLQFGGERATGEILGIVDAGIVPTSDGWLEELVSTLWRDGVGAAGGAIRARGGSLADAGYMADAAGALKPLFARKAPGADTYFGWTELARTVDAVDARCLFTKSALFHQTGGLTAAMRAWAGHDYCLRLAQAGQRTVWWPYAHFASGIQKEPAPTAGVEVMARTWQGRLRPFNQNLFALGPGLDLVAPGDRTHDFSEAEYLKLYPDVGRSRVEPLAHYLHYGLMQGRNGRIAQLDYTGLTPERVEAWRSVPANGVVVCTALCGDYEELLPPAFLKEGWRYVCYSDRPRNGWGVWDVRPIPYTHADDTRRARWVKLNLPFLFPEARWLFWLDANIVIRGDLAPLLEGREGGPGLWLGRHPVRNCVYEEARVCVVARKDKEHLIQGQAAAYARAGMPENFGMWETGSLLIDPASEKTRAVFADWWKECSEWSRRDQLSLPFVFYRHGYSPGELFPDGLNERTWPALTLLTHEETRWMPKPPALTPPQEER